MEYMPPPNVFCNSYFFLYLPPTGHPRDVSRVFQGRGYVQHATLQPGEILFLPSLTFHMVTAGEGNEISVGVSAMSKRYVHVFAVSGMPARMC